MLKKLSKIILSLTMVFGLVFSQSSIVKADGQTDINIIKGRLKEYFLGLDTIDDGSKVETCYVSKASDYLALIREDGSFADVDYNAHNNAANGSAWSPYLAVDRLQAIAIAYHKEGNALYHSEAAKDGVDKALKYWVTQGSRKDKPGGPYSTNWWENEVGVQLRFARIGLFMEGVISEEGLKIINDKLIEQTPPKYGTGQNNLWFDQNHVYHALLTNDTSKLKDMITNYLDYCLSAQLDDKTAEAVQVDNSFYMHGKQFYSNGYGMSMFRDMSFWIYILRGTDFSISQDVVNRMGNYMLNGTSWTIRGDIQELYLGYRPYKFDVGYENYAEEYIEPLKRMIASDPKRADEYKIVLDNIQGKRKNNGKNGNYYMWRSAYSSHMNDKYGVNIKMDSKDIIGGEWRGSWTADAPKKGQLIYWSSSASSTFTVDGDEYTSIYPTFDWAHTPGTTTPNRIPEDYSNYGRLTNGNDHTIGVSNGKYGNTAYVMNKKDTQATKGYFMFGDEIVALGAGINSKEAVNIHTTLNQSKANNVIVDGQSVSTGTNGGSYTGKWIHNDKIGYVFPKSTTFKVSNTLQKDVASLWGDEQKNATPETFTAWVDHGVKPTDASYSYIVVPGKTSAQVEQYSNNIPVTVVANTKDIQAVRHDGLKLTQINFYKAGSLEYKPGYTISVDQACSLMIDESTGERKLTVAVTDNESHKQVNIGLTYNNTKTVTTFVSNATPYAGQSITLIEAQDDRYLASSSTTNHLASNVLDGKVDTYWESKTNNEEWLSIFTNSNKFIRSVDITWGNNFAKTYEVYTSQNGVDYEKVSSVVDGKGRTETVPVSKICPYIKIVMKSSSSTNYQLKEIKLNEGELISLKKPAETSSVSAKAPTFVGSFAVDGDATTRWASSRDSDDEWITVNFQGIAEIDAIEINWENACSNNYAIQVSDDNKTWTTVAKDLKTDTGLRDVINLKTPTKGRYVRVHSYESRKVDGTNFGINIFELKVYGKVDETSVNIALNKQSKASSEYLDTKDKNKIYYSSLAFDGNTGKVNDQQSRWTSNRNTNDEWIEVDLEDMYFINSIILNWEGKNVHEYKVLVSKNSKDWKEVQYVTTGSGVKEIVLDEAVEARYVKVQGIKVGGVYGYSLWEFEVYGAKLRSQLKQAYDNKKDIDTKIYTTESVKVFLKTLENAITIYEDSEATATEINDAIKKINDAFDGLIEKADKDDLKKSIDDAESIKTELYTPNSVEKFNKILKDAKAVYTKENATQKEVDDAKETLSLSIKSLVLKANKSKLQELVNQVDKLDESKYVLETYQKVLAELNKVQKIIENQNSSQKEVNDAYNLLKEAIDSLVKKPNIDIEPEEDIKDKVVIKDSKNDITIVGKLPKDIQLKTKAYTKAQVEGLIEKIKKQNPQFLTSAILEKVFDIDLLLKDQKYNFDGTIQVIMKVDKELRDKNIGIVYIDEAGNVVKIKSTTDKEYITFNVSHLSTYAIVSYNDANDEGVAESGKVDVPKTNDNQYIGLYAVLGTVNFGYLIFRKRKSLVRNKK